ncbi:TPA: amidohydrolase [Streptococcus suis]
MRTIIHNAWVLTMDENETIYHPGYVMIEEGKIVELGHEHQLELDLEACKSSKTLELVDAKDGILIPGMINAHTHLGMVPFRSLGDDMPDRLRRFLFPLEAIMTEDLVRASTRYALAEMVLSGITGFADMYYFEEAVAEEVERFGMRALLGETVIQHPTCDSDGQTEFAGLSIGESFIKKWANKSDLISPMIAPHAPNTNNDWSLRQAKSLADTYQTPMMMHINEFDYEMAYYKEQYNTSPLGYLESLGLLDNRLIGVHLIHTDEEDLERLAQSGASVVHCIGANLKSAKGLAPLKEMLDRQIPLALGTDGPSSGNTLELFSIMRTVAISHKTKEKDRSFLPSNQILNLATKQGAKVLGLDKVGEIKPGFWADLTLVETQSVNMFPIHDPYAALVYSANAANVESVWIKGRQLVKNKALIDWDLRQLRQELIDQMSVFIDKAKELS